MQLCFGRSRFSIAHFYEVWLPTTFAKYFRFDSRLSLWLQLVLDSLIWNALNGKGLFWPPTIIWQHPEAVGYQSGKRSKTDANRDCDWGFLAWCRQRYVSTGRMDGRRTSAIWLISFLPFVRRFLWVINASRVTLLASAAAMALAAVHDMAKKMNENLRIIYSIFTDFFWVIRSSQRNSFLMDFGTKWEFLCAVCRWNECHLHSFLHHSH